MCPVWPLYIVIIYLLAICPLWLVTCALAPKVADKVWKIAFTPEEIGELSMHKTMQVIATSKEWKNSSIFKALVEDPEIISIEPENIEFRKIDKISWSAAFNITGKFLGYTSVRLCEIEEKGIDGEHCAKKSNEFKISVSRENRLLDKMFTGSVITLVSIIFINFGCALEMRCLKQAIIRPVGPIIGLVCHFLFMPLTMYYTNGWSTRQGVVFIYSFYLGKSVKMSDARIMSTITNAKSDIISYILGELFFPDSRSLRLGFFFTGISPAGGASNIWTFILGGNLNLSVTMTSVSTLASFALIPFWVFSLGSVIFSGGQLGVPYKKIVISAVGLLIPLAIGYALQIYCKRVAAVLVKILKPFSAFLIIFIVIFAVVTNFYLFKLFTLQILIVGLALPCLGYLIGWIFANCLKQLPEDKLAISIETGVQNTGVAIFLLRFCLPQPAADITTVAPVAVALMTPIPVVILYLIRWFTKQSIKSEEKLQTLNEENICL